MTIHEILKEYLSELQYPITARTIKCNTAQQMQLMDGLLEIIKLIKQADSRAPMKIGNQMYYLYKQEEIDALQKKWGTK